MTEKEFNLLHEPWILVIKHDGEIEELSLLDVFRRAHEFKGLAGELPTQDVVILRLLLAVMHAVFGRYDLGGEFAPLVEENGATPDDALKRWKNLWERASFPMEIIEKYLTNYEDRFWLFHPQYPFYQVAGLDAVPNTSYEASKLNGELSESSNKIRLFPQRSGKSKSSLSYAEAARWLLNVIAFDDTSSKPKGKNLPSPGAGWLGKIGIVSAVGENLFETIMLNFVMLKNGEDQLWEEESPVWEAASVKADERTEIIIPNNLSNLLTLQSRRILLVRQGTDVTGFLLLGGDFFQRENALAEQMTVWKNAAKKESDPPVFTPRRHDPSRQIWRDFQSLFVQKDTSRRPGVIDWLAKLKNEDIMPRSHFRFQTPSVKYGDKDFFVEDVFSDTISINANLLSKLNDGWISRIIDEIGTTDRLVSAVGYLANNLVTASGGDGGYQRSAAREQAYFRLDAPFRAWLEDIDPSKDKISEKCDVWFNEAKNIVRTLGKELVDQSGSNAFIGRDGMSSPRAYTIFLGSTKDRHALMKGGGGK